MDKLTVFIFLALYSKWSIIKTDRGFLNHFLKLTQHHQFV
jgi:hypothetical protein